MKIAVSSEYHFVRGADGVYTDASYPYKFWSELADVFDEVVLLARVGDRPARAGDRRVDGPGVRVVAVPDFVGPGALVTRAPGLVRAAVATTRAVDVVLVRAPGVVATAVHAAARATRRPYAIEVVGDPGESLVAAGGSLVRLATIGRWLLRRQVAGASASRFVTQRVLQRRFPPRPDTFTIGASDLELPDDVFAQPPVAIAPGPTLDLVFVGSLARPYKGLDVLLAALARTRDAHRLTVVGDGALRPALEADAAARGLAARVQFVGTVPAHAVFDQLRAADLFVLPTRTEGLPRSLIEAMAVGLPCLASPVGGVPELLPTEAQVAVDDVAGLARALDALAHDPARRARLGGANRETARDFGATIRRQRLRAFYRAIRAVADGR